uniref:Ig-like domain-containing protein n=1 Tax=Poecilia formosa TaxID=48698 RepID=A0A096M190_POEFO
MVLCVPAVQGSCPVIYHQTQICAVTGSAVTISCSFSPPARDPDAVLETQWFLNGRPVGLRPEPDSADRIQTLCGPTACTLRLTDLRESNSGRYRFWFRTNNGSYCGSPGVSLNVTGNISLKHKYTLNMNCNVSELEVFFLHKGHFKLRNKKINEYIFSEKKTIQPFDYKNITSSNKLFVLNYDLSSSPALRVQVSEELNCGSSCSAGHHSFFWIRNVSALKGDALPLHPRRVSKKVCAASEEKEEGRNEPWCLTESKNVTLYYGPLSNNVSVTLTCSSDANPAASYSWYKEDEESPRASGQTFIITDVRPEHSGNYSCRAENTRGRQSS